MFNYLIIPNPMKFFLCVTIHLYLFNSLWTLLDGDIVHSYISVNIEVENS